MYEGHFISDAQCDNWIKFKQNQVSCEKLEKAMLKNASLKKFPQQQYLDIEIYNLPSSCDF